MLGNEVYLEDLNSTNGSYINGKAIKKQLLKNDDVVEIGKYRIKFSADMEHGYEKTMVYKPGALAGMSKPVVPPSAVAMVPPSDAHVVPPAAIKVMSGVAAGREVNLVKVVTTIGKPGIAIAAITKRPNGYVLAHVEGLNKPSVNGLALSGDEQALQDGDVIELAGTQMQFLHK
jgi:hypothetical protein